MNNFYLKSLEIEYEKIPKEDYIADLNVVKNIRKLEFKTPVTFFVGENGLGKSTLIEAIATKWGFNAEGGRKLAENVFNAVKSYTYNIDFGKTVAFSNCLINGAKPSFSSDTDEEGYPIAGSIELSFTTIAPSGLSSVSNAQAVRFGGRG